MAIQQLLSETTLPGLVNMGKAVAKMMGQDVVGPDQVEEILGSQNAKVNSGKSRT